MNAQGSGESFLRRAWRYGRWIILALAVAYIALVIYRIPAVQDKNKTAQAVQNIEAQHLTMDDVDGNHLPPPPDPKLNDATVAGIDANGNGIRDDVELAIFQKYPGQENLKIRAAELQYAMALQMELTEVFNSSIWQAVTQQRERALSCLYDVVGSTKLSTAQSDIEQLVINTSQRNDSDSAANKYEVSFKLLQGQDCDIN